MPPTFPASPPVHSTQGVSVGPGELLVLVVLVLLVGGGGFYFIKGLAGRRIAFAVMFAVVAAASLSFVAPIFGVVALILGIPLAVGVARGMGPK